MSEPLQQILGTLVVTGVLTLILMQGYLLVANPRRYMEWFVAKGWRTGGVEVRVVDERKLRRCARPLGVVSLVAGGIALIALLWAFMQGRLFRGSRLAMGNQGTSITLNPA